MFVNSGLVQDYTAPCAVVGKKIQKHSEGDFLTFFSLQCQTSVKGNLQRDKDRYNICNSNLIIYGEF